MDDGIPLCSFLLNIEFYSWNEIFNPFKIQYAVYGIAILILLSFTAILCALEVAIFMFSNAEVKRLEQSSNKTDALILHYILNPNRFIATFVLTTTLFTLAIVLLFEALLEQWIREDFIHQHSTLLFIIKLCFETFIIVLFAEVIPKLYSTQKYYQVCRAVIYPINILDKIFSPFVTLMMKFSDVIEKRLIVAKQTLTAQDIHDALEITESQSTEVSKERTKILKGIVKFGNLNVSQIMRSRIDMVAIDHDADFHDLLTIVRESGYSRIPVFENDMDRITGIIYIKDLLKYLHEKNNFDWEKLMRPPLFVPENKKIDDLLEDIQERHIHIAIVVDEYGSCCGLVTLEDVLEEVIGDIKDEFDDASEIDFKKLDNNNYIFEAKTALNDVCKVMDLPTETFDEIRGTADSLAGMLLELNNEIPKEGDEIKYGKFTFLILEASITRIIRVKISIA